MPKVKSFQNFSLVLSTALFKTDLIKKHVAAMDMMEQVIDPAKIYMKVVKIILNLITRNIFRMRFVLFEDLPSPTEKNFKKLPLQQVRTKVSIHWQPIFSNRFLHYGLHRIFRQADSYSDQQYYCRIICFHII